MFRRLLGKPLGVAGAVIVLAMLALAAGAEHIAPYGYDDADIFARLTPSSAAHWLGTDNLGRDLLSRVIHGARISLAVGLGGVGLGLIGAIAVGLTSGYLGGRFEMLVQRVVDAFMCFPLLLVALTIMALLGPGLGNVRAARPGSCTSGDAGARRRATPRRGSDRRRGRRSAASSWIRRTAAPSS